MWFDILLLGCLKIEGGLGSGECNGHTMRR
jgi:hypothetical protein